MEYTSGLLLLAQCRAVFDKKVREIGNIGNDSNINKTRIYTEY